ncbi:MAG: 6-bladed beta-propeller [Mediterranea sp.]|jgi:hypothetical protein|nr:6-bladed beta-propeller [Mediterranea sp.]
MDDVERIPVDVSEQPSMASNDFIEKIEVVPLETNDSSIFHKYKKIAYNKEMDLYAIYTSNQDVFVFSGSGKYVANSNSMQGQGPNEYYMVVDMAFNPYMKGIDLLNPYGIIYTYSPRFRLLSKRKVESKIPLMNLMPLNADEYIFAYSSFRVNQEVLFANLSTGTLQDASYTGTISGNSMSPECFYNINGRNYYVPIEFNYYIFQIDAMNKRLKPVLYLDFGDATVDGDALPGRATCERSNSDRESERIGREYTERYKYLRTSNKVIPLIRLFNERYIYVYSVQTERGIGSTYIFDRETGKHFLAKNGKPLLMGPCFAISGNVLMLLTPLKYLHQAIDRQLMSKEELQKIDQLKDDDNPVILKYYLKQ